MSTTDQVEVKFECLRCGGTTIELPDDYTDDSIAKCKTCETEFGRWGDVNLKAIEVVHDGVRQKFRDSFKGLKGWKMK